MGAKRNSVSTIGIRQIEKSADLMMGVPQKDIDKYEKVVSAFGNVAPAIVAANGGVYNLLDGHARLEAYIRAGISDIPAVIAPADGEAEQLKLSLLLSASRERGGALGEGAIIDKLVRKHGFTLGELSLMVGRSKAWLSKRQTMARNLAGPLREMVIRGVVCTRAAEEISKLPRDEQVVFATNAVKEALNKEDIHRLVRLYRSPDATPELCRAVIESPAETLPACLRVKRPGAAHVKNSDSARLHRTACHIIGLLESLGKMICAADGAAVGDAMGQLSELSRKMAVISQLIAAETMPGVYPGKREVRRDD